MSNDLSEIWRIDGKRNILGKRVYFENSHSFTSIFLVVCFHFILSYLRKNGRRVFLDLCAKRPDCYGKFILYCLLDYAKFGVAWQNNSLLIIYSPLLLLVGHNDIFRLQNCRLYDAYK